LSRAIDTLAIKPIVDEVFPLDRAPAALARLEAATHFGKLVVRVA
jgi:NADPH:quinone reductase-like Zn-dependent oxidoreductase